MQDGTTIATHYFPSHHPDPRNHLVHGAGWTESELLRAARPRFAIHWANHDWVSLHPGALHESASRCHQGL